MPGSATRGGVWSPLGREITFDRLQQFWSELPLKARQELLRIDKQTFFEKARKDLHCSRCNGLLLDGYAQIVMFGKSLQQHVDACEHLPTNVGGGAEEMQDPLVHPWGGLATTREGMLTLLNCFISAKSLKALQNVFDNARARERERELLYPDACGGGGRGWISQGIINYGRGHGVRDTCALHTARLSCDTLVDFWSALSDETRWSLLRMKEDDFIERLMYRFDSKRFCRDCRRNVIREFKELKELKRMRRELRCTSWFCVADTAFLYEVSEDTVQADWQETFTDSCVDYHHFEWAIGRTEGKNDLLDFEDVGTNGKVQKSGLDLVGSGECFITVRAWKHDGRCTEISVKAHALKGQPCVHRRLTVGDDFVTITPGESIRRFFEHAEEAEEEDEDDAMDKDGNEIDDDGYRTQKHAKSPELAREFLLDAAMVIFKEQVEKAFKEGTARQNAHGIFVCLAIKLLEDRVLVACKDIITLEKQTKLLEEEEREKRVEEERKERRRTKEREKKLRRKERLKEREKERERKLVESKHPHDLASLNDSPSCTSAHDDSNNTPGSVDSSSEQGDTIPTISSPLFSDFMDEHSPYVDAVRSNLKHLYPADREFTARDCTASTAEHVNSPRQNLRFRKDSSQDSSSNWYASYGTTFSDKNFLSQDECDTTSSMSIGGLHKLSRERLVDSSKNCSHKFSERFHCSNNRLRDRNDFLSCSCGYWGKYMVKNGHHIATTRLNREIRHVHKTASATDMPRPFYRSLRNNNRCYAPSSFISKGNQVSGTSKKEVHMKQVWEPTSTRKQILGSSCSNTLETQINCGSYEKVEVDKEVNICLESRSELQFIDKVQSGSPRKVNSDSLSNHQACEQRVNQDTCGDGFVLVNNSDCSTDSREDVRVIAGVTSAALGSSKNAHAGTNSGTLDNSSCLSEEESSMSSSSTRNAESCSMSDLEDTSQESDGRDTSSCLDNGFSKNTEQSLERIDPNTDNSLDRTAAGLPSESCVETCFSGGSPTEAVHISNSNRFVAETIQPEGHVLGVHNQSIHAPPFFPIGYHNNNAVSWVVPNGWLPFAQHHHFVYPGHVVYGAAANQPSDLSMYHDTPQPLPPAVFAVDQHPMYYKFNRISVPEPVSIRSPVESQLPNKCFRSESQLMNKSSIPEKASNLSDENPSFSLFHFGGPVASAAAGSIWNEPCPKKKLGRESLPNLPSAQAHGCSKEEAAVEEYQLFSAGSGNIFSFFQSR